MRYGDTLAMNAADEFYIMHAGMENKIFLNVDDAKDWFVKLSHVTDQFALEVLKLI
jgi:hypothetical protein